ncbi:MAG: hypothetical protein LIQ31_11255, partial [Planctomycetes bacterium]|nr:hypothetical protein [Planctomycetota bacterium]
MTACDLPYETETLLVQAERRGRAAVELLPRPLRDGERLDIHVDASPDGLAGLAAARWALLCRLPVRVVLDRRVKDSQPWSILADNIRILNVPVVDADVPHSSIRRVDSRSVAGEDVPIPDDTAVWRLALDQSPAAGVWPMSR